MLAIYVIVVVTIILIILPVCMSPVSPVFHTEATVSIGLKNVLRVGTPII